MIISIKGRDAKGNPAEFEAGFKFNNHAFEALTGIKNMTTLTAWTIATLYVGYKGWCFAKQLDERLTFEDFSDYVDLAIDDETVRTNLGLISAECAATAQWQKMQQGLKKNEFQSEPNGIA